MPKRAHERLFIVKKSWEVPVFYILFPVKNKMKIILYLICMSHSRFITKEQWIEKSRQRLGIFKFSPDFEFCNAKLCVKCSTFLSEFRNFDETQMMTICSSILDIPGCCPAAVFVNQNFWNKINLYINVLFIIYYFSVQFEIPWSVWFWRFYSH